MRRLASLLGTHGPNSPPSGRFGPNSAQVERFLQAVRNLTPEQWEQVYDARAAAVAAYGHPDWQEIEAAHRAEYGDAGWLDSLGRVTRLANNWLDGQAAIVAHGAVLALADCDVMTAEQFAACYAAFAELIPIESLGPGKAPTVAKPPLSLHERFAMRARALEPHQWQQVVKVAQAVEDAVGIEAIDATIDAVGDALVSTGFDVEVLSAAWADIDDVSEKTSVKQLKGLYERMAGVVKKPAWAAGRIASFDTEIDNYRLAARRAVLAVAARETITPQQFAILYAPFAGLVPIESLEAKRLW